MARILLTLRDVRGGLIDDPRVLVRFVNTASGHSEAYQASTAGEQILINVPLATGSFYRVEITPSRYSPALRGLNAVSDEHELQATLLHRASEWSPDFTPWAALGAAFEPLEALLAASRRFIVGRGTAPVTFTDDEYDGVDPEDESRVLAKASLLNMFALLSTEPRPAAPGGRWADGLGELFLATRERIVGAITERDAQLIERIAQGAHAQRYAKASAALHADNFALVPGFTFVKSKLFSVKTRDDFGNLQLTVARGALDGLPAVLLDADCDENGRAFAHLLDLPRHAVTGGTHPIEIHDILVHRDPARDLGYALIPTRTREEHAAARLDARVAEVRAAAAALPAQPRRIGVIGDSVTWGQGLLDPQKIHAILHTAFGGTDPPPVSIAHSGAVIGVGLDPNPAPPVHPEVPRGRPTILEQVAAFQTPEQIDLLLVNGGINDLDIRYILNPATSVDELVDDTRRVCGVDMRELLDRVCRRFSKPAARIFVLSYYPILSRLSDPLRRTTFLDQLAIALPAATDPPAVRLAFWDRIIENCAAFHAASSAATAAAVTAVNAGIGAGRLRFIAPPFTDENAALAPKAWLFGLSRLFGPEDPVKEERRRACDLHETDIFRRLQCHRASAGHPNPLGAVEFAAAAIASLAAETAVVSP